MSENLKICAGNWKANGSLHALREWAGAFDNAAQIQAILFVPHPLLVPAAEMLAGKVEVGAQDIAVHGKGAHTGNTIAELVTECGASWTLVGHSERRAQGETDEQCAAKISQAQAAGLKAMLCVGETTQERQSGRVEEVLASQLDRALGQQTVAPGTDIAIAYEPVWAVGTGEPASAEDAQQACGFIRRHLAASLGGARIKVLYGGSVKSGNAADFTAMPGIDGLLVGGASLDASSFSEICTAAIA